jgi:hypothetical protein
MSEYRETHRIVEGEPIKRARPVVETQYDTVVHESRGLSGGAVVALVLAGIAAAVLITMMILNSQQRESEDQLARERERIAETQQLQQPPPQQPVIVLPPSQPPAQVPVPVPAPAPGASSTAPSTTEIELDITSRLLDDQELRSQSIDVKFSDGTAVLSGRVSSEELKTRAEKITRAVKGVRNVLNNITVQSNQLS